MTALPSRPRLRPLEAFPVEQDGEQLVCLRDPSGLSPHVALLPRAGALVVSLMDGRRDLEEIAGEAGRRLGGRLDPSLVRSLCEKLDEALLLASPRFAAHLREVTEAFRAAPDRPASHAGSSYPDDADQLAAALEANLAALPSADAPAPLMLLAPHIDFGRGAPVYADAYRNLAGADFDLVVVFGTDHAGEREPLTLTRKSYATPLGLVETDVALVDGLVADFGERLFAEELHHRSEHSIEFQAVWLKHLFGGRMPPMLPVLCGGLGACAPSRGPQPDAAALVERFCARLRELAGDRRVLVVAGADLAHVGPRFGDRAFDARACAEVEAADRRALAAATRGDAAGFWSAVAAEHDRYRVCGLAPIWASLAYLGGRAADGELLAYAQCPADEAGESWVSIAAAALR